MIRNSVIILLLCAPLVVAAFWPLYLSRPFASTDRYTHFHAVTGTLWFLLLIAQPLAIQFRRLDLHRALGRISYVVAPMFVLAGVLLSHHRLRSMSDEVFVTEGYSHYLPIYASVVFAVAFALGIRFKRPAKAHGRFMILTAMPMIDPVIGRILFFYLPELPAPWLYQVVTFGLATLAAAFLVFSYRDKSSARRALIGYFCFLVVLELGWFSLARTPAWLDVMGWFRSLPLT